MDFRMLFSYSIFKFNLCTYAACSYVAIETKHILNTYHRHKISIKGNVS